jgi:hypothetical protein
MSVLNEYTDANYFIPPAYGKQGLQKRHILTSDELSKQFVEVYPNPSDYMTTIQLLNDLPTEELCMLQVTDIMGKVIMKQLINPELRTYQIDTRTWSSGLYIFSITLPDSTIEVNGKIEVQH